jgi:hypothetical protein
MNICMYMYLRYTYIYMYLPVDLWHSFELHRRYQGIRTSPVQAASTKNPHLKLDYSYEIKISQVS